jgi:hypothetical protein
MRVFVLFIYFEFQVLLVIIISIPMQIPHIKYTVPHTHPDKYYASQME